MSINRDVKVKIEARLIITEMKDVDNPSGRGGEEGSGKPTIIRVPEFVVNRAELDERIADSYLVLQKGYELTGTQPPRPVTEHVCTITANTAILHGRIEPNVNTSCGFVYGTTKELNSTQDCNESPLAGLTDDAVAVTTNLAGLTPNTRYYYRLWAQLAGLRVRYGRIRSFVTLSV